MKKFGATSCVCCATMQEPKDTSDVKIRNFMKELSLAFTGALEQVNVSYHIDIVCV